MNHQNQVFNHPQFGEICTVQQEEGKVLFKANDVARSLGYAETAKAVRTHCKGVSVLDTPIENQYGTVVMQPTKFISESDVYRLVMRSKLPEAEKFQDWVCEEVLPAIRKDGAYRESPATRSDRPGVLYRGCQCHSEGERATAGDRKPLHGTTAFDWPPKGNNRGAWQAFRLRRDRIAEQGLGGYYTDCARLRSFRTPSERYSP